MNPNCVAAAADPCIWDHSFVPFSSSSVVTFAGSSRAMIQVSSSLHDILARRKERAHDLKDMIIVSVQGAP